MTEGYEAGDFRPDVPGVDADQLRSPLTRIFEAGLAVGVEPGSGCDRKVAAE